MDDDAHVVRRAGDEVPLSPTEYNLLRFLLVNQGRVLSKAQILDHVWQYDFGGDGGVVETYIGYLRKKVDQVDPRLIQTVRGCRATALRGDAHGIDRSMSLRARLLAGMAVVSFVLVAAAVIIARTTEAQPRRPGRRAAGVGRPLGPGGRRRRARGPSQLYGAPDPGRRHRSRVRPDRRRRTSPARPARHGRRGRRSAAPRASEPFTVGSIGGSGRYRMLASRAPDGSISLVGLSLQDVDATMSRLRLVLDRGRGHGDRASSASSCSGCCASACGRSSG